MNYLDYFKKICSMPHGSGNTKIISDYLVEFAKEHNLEHYQDASNNVIIIKEASKGRENDEPVIIQGHMDMVAVQDEDCKKDMTKEGLDLCVEDDFMFAKGTSLGGDDGIAVAYGLALLDDDSLSLPRIELVVTVDEEIGMLGAAVIDLSPLKGHTMLNIDSEEEGTFLTSCAGGARIDMHFPMKQASFDEGIVYKINISKLIGGHSGAEIDKGRANAIVLCGQILKKLAEARLLLAVNGICGGTADNAIANSCEAVILAKHIEPELFDIIKYEVLENYLTIETQAEITLSVEKTQVSELDWYVNDEDHLENFLTALPNGIIAMSQDIEGLVETSLNQGIITMDETGVSLSISVRSSIDDKKAELIDSLLSTADNFHATYGIRGDYPGWAFRKESPLRDKMIAVYEEMFGTTPGVTAIHAGLECGIFAQKINDLDCISFGPWLYDIHTTKEKMSLSSAERMWNYLVKILL